MLDTLLVFAVANTLAFKEVYDLVWRYGEELLAISAAVAILISISLVSSGRGWVFKWPYRFVQRRWHAFLKRRRQKGKHYMRHAQVNFKPTKAQLLAEAKEKQVIADMLTDALLEAHAKDLLATNRYSYWMKRLGNLLDNEDLLPRGNKALKKLIKERLAAGDYKPVNIPGPKPGEPTAKLKEFGSAYKQRRNRAA